MNRGAGVTRRVRSTDDSGFPWGRPSGLVGRAHRKAVRQPHRHHYDDDGTPTGRKQNKQKKMK